MALIPNCPKCDTPLQNKASFFLLGILGAIAFPKFYCPTHGEIKISDFPEEQQKKLESRPLILGIIFVALCIFALIAIFSGWT
jgi:hypothetical protein